MPGCGPWVSGTSFSAVNVLIPPLASSLGRIQSRVPDVIISRAKPDKRFVAGDPPDLVIEILATPRGNVERSEKMDDYSRAGIQEYWIVDPFRRLFEVYLLRGGDYVLQAGEPTRALCPEAFPGLQIFPDEVWTALD